MTGTSPLDEYLTAARPEDAWDEAAIRELDGVVRAAAPDLESAVKYRILMYTRAGDWRHWICAINTQRSGVCLRFLYGVLLDDPHGVLRKGSAQLMTWDVARGQELDPDAVAAYVRQAVDLQVHYRENAAEISAASKAVPATKRPRRR